MNGDDPNGYDFWSGLELQWYLPVLRPPTISRVQEQARHTQAAHCAWARRTHIVYSEVVDAVVFTWLGYAPEATCGSTINVKGSPMSS